MKSESLFSEKGIKSLLLLLRLHLHHLTQLLLQLPEALELLLFLKDPRTWPGADSKQDLGIFIRREVLHYQNTIGLVSLCFDKRLQREGSTLYVLRLNRELTI
jgi:hypothetical protein